MEKPVHTTRFGDLATLKVSVILTTARYGSWDVLHDCMASQTMDKADFEVVVVDELFHLRPDFRHRCAFQCDHMAPWRAKDHYDNGAGFNQALSQARGELVCFFVDFMHVDPGYLERHWQWYKDNPGWTLTGYIDRYDFPKLREHAHEGLWSMFAEPFTPTYFWTHRPVYSERKGGKGTFAESKYGFCVEITGDKIYLIPDSVPMAVLRKLNGIDEIYDGGYGVNDIDLGVRANMVGHRFALDSTFIARKLGTPSLSGRIPGLKKPYRGNLTREQSWQQNYAVYERRMEAIRDGREPVAVPPGRGAFR